MTERKEDQPRPRSRFQRPSQETLRALAGVEHEFRTERTAEAFRALVELRKRHAGLAKRLVVHVYVPECEDCYAYGRHRIRADDATWKPPSILAKTWRRDLREYGASESDLRRIARNREEATVQCRSCGGDLCYGEDSIYVHGQPFEDYFPELVGPEDRDPPRDPPKFVQKLVYAAYEGRCAGCGVQLAWSEKSMDHIHPKHAGGPGTLENIQLACKKCNNELKRGETPEPIYLWLDFALIPPGPKDELSQRLAGL